MSQPKLTQKFAETFEQELEFIQKGTSTEERWGTLRDIIHSTAMEAFGKRTTKTTDWFEAKSSLMIPAIESKRIALAEYKRTPSQKNLLSLRAARGRVQCMARLCANEYWQELSETIQKAAISGNVRGMYDGIKRAVGPNQCKTSPLKSSSGVVLSDKNQQMERWVKHYTDLYSTQNTVTVSALDAIECLPTMDELDVEPTLEELSKAIDNLASGKAPGNDGIPPDLLKQCKSSLLSPLHKVLCECWEDGSVPQDMRDAKIITLYKNKGERSDCNNYRGISLLSIVGKVFARVILIRLQELADRVYSESQCGFRSKRSTIDMIFSLRQLQEKCREQQMPLYISFIDLTKAFDLVSRDGLFKILPTNWMPKLLSLVTSFHVDMKGTVQFNGSSSEPFSINSGVKQGCVLAPTLFGIFFAMLLKHAFGASTEGIYLRTRSDGNLFSLSRFKAKTKVRDRLIRDLLFADGAAVVTHTHEELQTLMNRFSMACGDFGLTISLKKTNVLSQNTSTAPAIAIDDYQLDVVHQFTYLGSTITDNLSLDVELDKRIGKATSTLAQLSKRVWTNPTLKTSTKMAVYNACIISTLLYGSESWTTYSRQERRLNAFHLRCLRRILGISWQDKVPNTEVLSRANLPSMFTMLRQRRLRWLGHVRRMDDGRIPKDILYGELRSGKRSTGRPQLRFKDVVKRDMKTLDIYMRSWEDLAADRPRWRSTLLRQIRSEEEKFLHAAENKGAQRKQRLNPERSETIHRWDSCRKECLSRIELFSHKRCCQRKTK
ncbi:uncharacterized protein LOC128155711 [Crassostrea angulata]|uniref:uncharacterized protein LOC128155711 n=1 Tax=Magallana angulata TaxID=2784310 RepID=UPI0022B12922|nr:uncharacterized protein LOC128155711 [Crassostrea angulata]